MSTRQPTHCATSANQPNQRPFPIEPERARSRFHAAHVRRVRCGGGYRIIRKRIPGS
jgi:hypothetical protein